MFWMAVTCASGPLPGVEAAAGSENAKLEKSGGDPAVPLLGEWPCSDAELRGRGDADASDEGALRICARSRLGLRPTCAVVAAAEYEAVLSMEGEGLWRADGRPPVLGGVLGEDPSGAVVADANTPLVSAGKSEMNPGAGARSPPGGCATALNGGFVGPAVADESAAVVLRSIGGVDKSDWGPSAI
jgi:hypothetical protein